jgi:hypothetical protein
MIIHIDGEADLFSVLLRLSGTYVTLAGAAASPASVRLTTADNGIAVSSAFGNSCE